jgi:hypothetical protein
MHLASLALKFGASFASVLHPREGEKTRWEHSPQLSASATTFTTG